MSFLVGDHTYTAWEAFCTLAFIATALGFGWGLGQTLYRGFDGLIDKLMLAFWLILRMIFALIIRRRYRN